VLLGKTERLEHRSEMSVKLAASVPVFVTERAPNLSALFPVLVTVTVWRVEFFDPSRRLRADGAFAENAEPRYVKAPVEVTVWVSTFVTTTSLAPAAPAGVEQVIDVAETTLTPVHAEPPTVTVAPVTNPVPVIVIDVPPAVGPLVSAIEVMVGAGAGAGATPNVQMLPPSKAKATAASLVPSALEVIDCQERLPASVCSAHVRPESVEV